MEDESERNDIRTELSKMSFDELQKLKERLGSKVYKEAMFGSKIVLQKEFKRENKNRPREASSKIKPTVKLLKKNDNFRDPRFDRLCGEYNEGRFKKDYSFISDIRQSEKAKLQRLLKTEKNPEKVSQLKYLIQRMQNQDREESSRLEKIAKKNEEREEYAAALKEGQKPHFRTKYERKVVDLVGKYEKLKSSGKLIKHIEKQRKKLNVKDKKKYFDVNIDN